MWTITLINAGFVQQSSFISVGLSFIILNENQCNADDLVFRKALLPLCHASGEETTNTAIIKLNQARTWKHSAVNVINGGMSC